MALPLFPKLCSGSLPTTQIPLPDAQGISRMLASSLTVISLTQPVFNGRNYPHALPTATSVHQRTSPHAISLRPGRPGTTSTCSSAVSSEVSNKGSNLFLLFLFLKVCLKKSQFCKAYNGKIAVL